MGRGGTTTARTTGSAGDVSVHREAARGAPQQTGRHARPFLAGAPPSHLLFRDSSDPQDTFPRLKTEARSSCPKSPCKEHGPALPRFAGHPRGAGRPPPLRPDQHRSLGDWSWTAVASAQGTRRALGRCSIAGRHPAQQSGAGLPAQSPHRALPHV